LKLVTFSIETPLGLIDRVGAQTGDGVIDLAAAYARVLAKAGVFAARELAEEIIPADMTHFLSRWPTALEGARAAIKLFDCDGPDASSPSGGRVFFRNGQYRLRCALRPRRIKDYLVFEEHKKKSMQRRGLPMPELWYKMPTYTNRNVYGLADPDQDITWPGYSQKLDFEFEIGAVIGRAGRDINPEDAHGYIAGFTIYNDLSARDIQADEGSIGAGAGKSKDFDQGNVLGPCIVTPDEIDPANIQMVLRVNGEEWSRGSTAGMKFSWGEIIANASKGETIYPGDVFGSGTMDRGCSLELNRWISPGAVIEMDAKGIGVLRNRIVRG
jgi:2-keto-4-pentenoate hydratase/2-oxohepta-3-ene-1,7-dioic acid hydratase in catechol pathway